MFGCFERAEQIPPGFTPSSTKIIRGGTSLPWDEAENMPVVPVMINGAGPFRFLVDTGASHVLIDQRLAERLQLPRHGTAVALRSAANTSVDTEQPAVVTTLTVGDAHFADFSAHVFDFTRMEIDGDMPMQIDGILGSALFVHALLTIDYPKRNIQVASGTLPGLGEENIHPLILNAYMPYVMVRLETGSQQQDRWALIDTGSDGSLGVGPEWGLRYATATIDGGLNITASGEVSARHARIERMRLGALSFLGPEVSIRDDQRDPRIGQQLLSGFRVTFDFANHRARFQITEHTITLGPSWSHGFSARPCRRPGTEGRIVNWIASDSPAAKLLQLGDRLLTINGQSTARMSNRTYRNLMQQAVDLTIARATTTLQVSLPIFDDLPWTPPGNKPPGDSGRALALYSVAGAYFNGNGVPKDEAKALTWFRQAAEQGDPGAQNLLGGLTAQGQLVPKDESVAYAWFHKSAEQGNPDAQYNLGRMHGLGIGVPKDEEQSLAWYRKAADQGDVNAQMAVGRIFGNGVGVANDAVEAATWFHKAAAQNDAEAQRVLGWIYANGRGVPRDDESAVAWYRKAAEQNHVSAQCTLAWMYGNGRGVPRDDAACVQWYSKAAEQDSAIAQSALGWLHANGRGVPQDQKKAYAWYHKAAEQDHAASQNDVGRMLTTGLGTPKDESGAIVWFRKAAEQGHADAQKNLALVYATGLGVPIDRHQSFTWFAKAAEQGHAEAQTNLGVHYANGIGVERDPATAREWFLKAAEQGWADAQNNLGLVYVQGLGVEKDVAMAREWFEKAAKQGHVAAKQHLTSLMIPVPTPP